MSEESGLQFRSSRTDVDSFYSFLHLKGEGSALYAANALNGIYDVQMRYLMKNCATQH